MVEGDILNLFSFDPDQFLIQIYVTLLFPTYRNYLFKPASQVGFFLTRISQSHSTSVITPVLAAVKSRGHDAVVEIVEKIYKLNISIQKFKFIRISKLLLYSNT